MHKARFSFLVANEGEINFGWCVLGGKQYHLLRKELCNQKDNPSTMECFKQD